MATQTLTFKRSVRAPAGEAYRAFTNATALRDWLADSAQADPRPQGRLYLWWQRGGVVTGAYGPLTPGKKVVFSWVSPDHPGPSRVQASFSTRRVSFGDADTATAITVRHTIGAGRQWAAAARALADLWPSALENLQAMLETGLDLRVMRRPFLGLMGVDDLTPERAAALGIPGKAGLWVAGAVEGLPAHAAGLQTDDVIVSIGGRPVTGWRSLGAALEGRTAGERVSVAYWRGARRQRVTLALGQRPAPDFPQTAAGLARAAQAVYTTVNSELTNFCEGVTDVQAARRPAAHEWHLKEMIAHYVACERDLHGWIAAMMLGGNHQGELNDSLEFQPNVTERLDALISVHATIPELMAELVRCENETLALIEALPDEFVARKHLFVRLASWVTQVIPGHIDEHREQFARTREAALQAG
jgi:uncharacterized protein YndB with AHSA1/START domain